MAQLCGVSPYHIREAERKGRHCENAWADRHRGDGGTSSGDKFGGENFVWEKFRHTPSFGAGPSDTGNFDIPKPWFLEHNQLCETLAAQISNNTNSSEIKKKKEQKGPGLLSILKEALARGQPTTVQQYLATTATEDAQRAGSAPNCAKKFRGGGKFRHQTEK